MSDLFSFITAPRTFPTAMIVMDVLAAGCYGRVGDWWKVIYWCAAAVLTAAVTYGME